MSDVSGPRRERLAVFGGSFNPPHLGHLIVAEHVRDQFEIDRLVWVPGYIPPHKQDHVLASVNHRLAMVDLATADNSGFESSKIEIERQGVSFTVDSLEQFDAMNPECDLYLIIGGDSFAAFETWYRPERISELATLIVYNRKNSGFDRSRIDDERILLASGPTIEISSSMVRSAVRSGRSIRYLVPDQIREYIEENRLYT